MVTILWVGDIMKIGFTGALTILFIALKLCNVIDWSWVWVLSPIWISAIIIVLAILISVITSFKE